MKLIQRTAIALIIATTCVTSLFADVPKNVQKRGEYYNSKLTFEQTGKGTVAFLGGSITEMEGYRPMLCSWLQEQFPKTKFNFIASGISSTCSTTGAFRLDRDVLSCGPIDLFFVEYAVNDDQDAQHEVKQAIRGMEGIVRHLREVCPNSDIVIVHFVNQAIMSAYRAGGTAKSIQGHNIVAQQYGISTIDLAREVTERIDSKKLSWQEFGGVHPSPVGNRIPTLMIAALLKDSWTTMPKGTKITPHFMPKPIDRFSYVHGKFLPFDSVDFEKPWTLAVPDWQTISGNCRPRFVKERLLCCNVPGSECTVRFSGSAIGAYLLAGPDSGIAEYNIDNTGWRRIDLLHSYSAGLQYPRSVVFSDELAPGQHVMKLRPAAEKNEKSTGHALRILNFEVN